MNKTDTKEYRIEVRVLSVPGNGRSMRQAMAGCFRRKEKPPKGFHRQEARPWDAGEYFAYCHRCGALSGLTDQIHELYRTKIRRHGGLPNGMNSMALFISEGGKK